MTMLTRETSVWETEPGKTIAGGALGFSSGTDHSHERKGTTQAWPVFLPEFTSW